MWGVFLLQHFGDLAGNKLGPEELGSFFQMSLGSKKGAVCPKGGPTWGSGGYATGKSGRSKWKLPKTVASGFVEKLQNK